MEENKELQVMRQTELVSSDEGIFLDLQLFEHGQRVAKMLAASTMVPEQFRGNVGNCMIALNFASRTKLDPFMVMQKMYVIKGRPGIEGQLVIALINNSGKFSPLQFRLEGEGKTRQCTAYATARKTGETCEQTVTWQMVEAEGWNKKPGSKWLTMPDLMFQYRAAAFFGRLYCPEALLGMMTKEELYDIPSNQQVKTISNLSERLKNLPINDSYTEPAEKQNPLYETPEWNKWAELSGDFPELVTGWPDPVTTEECIQARARLNQEIDKQNA